MAGLQGFILEKTSSYGYSKWNFHLRSLLNWHRWERIVDDFLRLMPKGLVLDVGCGFGQITEMLHLKGVRVVGIDIGGEIRENKVWKHLQGSFILGDGCNLPFKEGTFDAVVCCGVLEHTYNQHKFLKECRRVLKNDGLFLCFYLPNKTGLESLFSRIFPTGHKFYNKEMVKDLFNECDYSLVSIDREHMISSLYISDSAMQLMNKLNEIVTFLDDVLTKTPLAFFGNNWRVYARKNKGSP